MELVAREVDNDTRGWILSAISGIACFLGSAVICVDVLVRLFPGKRKFRIQDSNAFLACSLSLSFGVMMFSSLYSMLPEARSYLEEEGWDNQSAGFAMMGCFIGGFVGIQAVSRFLHQHMPSHVVDCDHSHDEDAVAASLRDPNPAQSRLSRARIRFSPPRSLPGPDAKNAHPVENGHGRPHESTLLLDSHRHEPSLLSSRQASALTEEMTEQPGGPYNAHRDRAATVHPAALDRRPSLANVQRRVMSFVKDTKCNCDEEGSCYGYTDPCAQECFKHLSTRSTRSTRHPALQRSATASFYSQPASTLPAGHEQHQKRLPQHHDASELVSPSFQTSQATSRDPSGAAGVRRNLDDRSCSPTDAGNDDDDDDYDNDDPEAQQQQQHHHDVPTNAFLSLSLQTSITIALHKFPEGFITYATNHANPTLGFSVFMALFVHNISEGFALALPLYMALDSHWRAMAWSALLGGLTQPMGAGIAALWFHLARRSHLTPNGVAFACLFAATAGIMVSVALQLFVEGLSLNHSRNLCIFFGFLGMALLGLSSAFFAAH